MAETWISLVEVCGLPGTEFAGDGAYVSGVVLADSAAEAERLMAVKLLELGWRVVGTEGTEELAKRRTRARVDGQLEELARIAVETQSPQFGDFYSWVNAHPNN